MVKFTIATVAVEVFVVVLAAYIASSGLADNLPRPLSRDTFDGAFVALMVLAVLPLCIGMVRQGLTEN